MYKMVVKDQFFFLPVIYYNVFLLFSFIFLLGIFESQVKGLNKAD